MVMTNKRNIGTVKLVKSRKYQKYEDPVAIPEPCPECEECEPCADSTCEECEPCADSTCEPCDTCAPEGTYCEGDGFPTCRECQQAWCQCQQQIEPLDCSYVPLGEPEMDGTLTITVLESGVQLIGEQALSGFRKPYKIKPACFTENITITIQITAPPSSFQNTRVRVKYGSPANPSNYDFLWLIPNTPGEIFNAVIDNVENQTVYIAVQTISYLIDVTFNITATLTNNTPIFESCAECCSEYTVCDDNLTTCEQDLIDCNNDIVILTNDIADCREDLANCTYDQNFMLYWSGGGSLGSVGGTPCIELTTGYLPIGDMEGIYQDPNLCSPSPNPMCDLHDNLCYCYQIFNLNAPCNVVINIGVPNCGTTVQSKQLLYIATLSRENFYANETFSYSEVTNFAGPGNVLIEKTSCLYETFSGGLYQRFRFFYLNEAVWTMPSLLDAVITMTSKIKFGGGSSVRNIERKIVFYINQP